MNELTSSEHERSRWPSTISERDKQIMQHPERDKLIIHIDKASFDAASLALDYICASSQSIIGSLASPTDKQHYN